LSVCITSRSFENEDTAKSDCFCDFCAFFKTTGCERHYFRERGASFKRLGTHGLKQAKLVSAAISNLATAETYRNVPTEHFSRSWRFRKEDSIPLAIRSSTRQVIFATVSFQSRFEFNHFSKSQARAKVC